MQLLQGGREKLARFNTGFDQRALHADSTKQRSGNTSIYLFDRLAPVLPRVWRITQVIGANALEGESNFAVAPIRGRIDTGLKPAHGSCWEDPRMRMG
jgi:hypothetical protein